MISETLNKERDRYGIDPDFDQRIDPEQEIESLLPVESEDKKLNDLDWYIINPNGHFAIIQNT